MSRFDRLEFEPSRLSSETQAREQHVRSPDLDEHHWMRRASDERRRGMFEEALRYYSRALESNRSMVDGWVGQVRMLVMMGEYPEAELWARKALELFKNNADLHAGRSQALCRSGDLKSAQAACDAAIGQPGIGSYPWTARGELMLARKEKNLDNVCFDKAVAADSDWLVPLEIGDIYLHYHRPTKALARVRQAVEKAPDQPHCWYRQGACETALGLAGPAGRSFARCLQLDPKHADALRALADLSAGGGWLKRLFKRLFGS